MPRAVAVGEKNLILGFKGVGFDIVPVENGNRLLHELNQLARDTNVGLVVVTESIAAQNPDAVADFRERSSAILTVIPTHDGSRHVSFEEIRKSVERSMGVDILGKD